MVRTENKKEEYMQRLIMDFWTNRYMWWIFDDDSTELSGEEYDNGVRWANEETDRYAKALRSKFEDNVKVTVVTTKNGEDKVTIPYDQKDNIVHAQPLTPCPRDDSGNPTKKDWDDLWRKMDRKTYETLRRHLDRNDPYPYELY